ncbi:hypothetical protein [Sinorhizobium alkalisoli]|uniref:hypothetical protein n=1 Tax=Sinorhizobium alkalisoli TaxID=1752398 RepID=UPI00124EA87C|nr:hypothetical protein [Sinorhizobium alkalisoli]QFI70437.1 hypothetical protein EKH55_5563 [Sinorhizobium alkalisoli]
MMASGSLVSFWIALFTLKAYMLGDKSVCRPVRLPTPEEEDAKRLSRERTQLKKERERDEHPTFPFVIETAR